MNYKNAYNYLFNELSKIRAGVNDILIIKEKIKDVQLEAEKIRIISKEDKRFLDEIAQSK